MVSRRTFLKVGGLSAAALALGRASGVAAQEGLPTGPDVVLGRVAWPWGVTVLTRPRPEGAVVRTVYPDELVQIRREVVGLGIMPHNHIWYELDDGFIYSSHVVPCHNWPQPAQSSLPPSGLWGEVMVPYVEGRAAPDPGAAVKYRMYSHAVYRLFEITPGADGQVWYRAGTEVTPFMYAPATAFRIIDPSEVTPISPEVSDKVMVIDLSRQTLTAVEGKAEVFRTRIASGAQFFGEDGQTLQGGSTVGAKYIWQKRYSRQMQGGTRENGWDIPGVPWVSYYAGNGEALHAAYWHNDFGRAKSRGCINLKPADALWLFRWTLPVVAYDPGDITVNMSNPGSLVDIRVRA
jgi:hypothetical protein